MIGSVMNLIESFSAHKKYLQPDHYKDCIGMQDSYAGESDT